MNDTSLLNGRDQENLVRAIEFSLPIRRRNQFFVWSQGILQGLIPHEVLFCAYGVRSGEPFFTDKYTTRPFPEAFHAQICNPREGLLMSGHAEWQRRGNTPLLICPEQGDSRLLERFGESLKRHDLVNCAVHGIPPFNGAAGSFFCFARMPGPLSPRHAYLLDMILPYLHVAFVRTLIHGNTLPAPKVLQHERAPIDTVLRRRVTDREIQILQRMHEGKRNREIGEILGISEFTVKNHVQSVLKKLKVTNRTQAVSLALSLRLIRSPSQRDS